MPPLAPPGAGSGTPALIREDTRAVWGWRWLDGLVWDLRHVARGLRRSPVDIQAYGARANPVHAVARWPRLPAGRPAAAEHR